MADKQRSVPRAQKSSLVSVCGQSALSLDIQSPGDTETWERQPWITDNKNSLTLSKQQSDKEWRSINRSPRVEVAS